MDERVGVEVDVVEEVRTALRAAADPAVAPGQQAYMKSAMPYRGVTSVPLRAICDATYAEHPLAGRDAWERDVRRLWDEATHREERYAATALARHRVARPWQDPATLDLYRHLVVTGAWWDHVDEVATHLVGGVLAGYRAEVTPVMRAWARDGDLWVRRTAVLSQANHKDRTDTDLLHDVVAANIADPSFWLRKAVGWALREYSKVDPGWVRAEVDGYGSLISGLSRREALRRPDP